MYYFFKNHRFLPRRVEPFPDRHQHDQEKQRQPYQHNALYGPVIRLRSIDAALQSGAQIITTDYYRKSTHFSSDYVISFDGGGFARENPLFTGKQ
ncbi:Ca2+-dependent phosphoinositide-specific phospholipase C [Dawidia soli]|uniref:Uncharacterized protein n=1 Tax=Dawidia soli TaxID=2782352 RepID=A0AAP2GDX9_9BACT|nr:Ca2+-dependent phosphoinositide-specific phospholipase C [Dawidia soli]MBT1687784.1 hypothetical protein [Dawidia soli]